MRTRALASLLILAAMAAAAPKFDTVYRTKSGTKYHKAGCRYLKKSKVAIDRADAKKLGLEPCSVCKP